MTRKNPGRSGFKDAASKEKYAKSEARNRVYRKFYAQTGVRHLDDSRECLPPSIHNDEYRAETWEKWSAGRDISKLDQPETQLERYERVAHEFYLTTGCMRPGKDDAAGMHTLDERREAWDKWVKKNPQNSVLVTLHIHADRDTVQQALIDQLGGLDMFIDDGAARFAGFIGYEEEMVYRVQPDGSAELLTVNGYALANTKDESK